MVVKGALGAPRLLTHALGRRGVVAVFREGASSSGEKQRTGRASSLGLRATAHFYTIRYISTHQYKSVPVVTAGLTLESPRIGQTITFVRTAEDSAGAELVIEAVMRPGAFMPPHRHLHQEESFEVLTGTGTFTVAGQRIVAGPGGQVHVATGLAHRFRNRSDTDVRIRATLRPALRTEDLFARLFQLGSEGRVNKLGAPSPRKTAALIREFRDEFFYLAGIPVSLQRLLAGTRP